MFHAWVVVYCPYTYLKAPKTNFQAFTCTMFANENFHLYKIVLANNCHKVTWHPVSNSQLMTLICAQACTSSLHIHYATPNLFTLSKECKWRGSTRLFCLYLNDCCEEIEVMSLSCAVSSSELRTLNGECERLARITMSLFAAINSLTSKNVTVNFTVLHHVRVMLLCAQCYR